MKTFLDPQKLLATHGYLLTLIETGALHILELSHDKLNIDEEEFKK
jgi:hypothetical protein